MEQLICPHCNKVVNPPYFIFCHHCNGDIRKLVDEFKKKNAEKLKSLKTTVATPKKPVFIDFPVSEISDSASFRNAFSNALKSSPIIGAINEAFSTENFVEMREILKNAADTINQLKKLGISSPQVLDIDATISGEESPVIKLIMNAKKFDATNDDIKSALDVFFTALVTVFLNHTLNAMEKSKNTNAVLSNLQLAQTIVKPTDFIILLGFIESFLSCTYDSIINVVRAEDHQNLAIEAFKRAKDEALIKNATENLPNANHLRMWINSYNIYFNKSKK